MAGLIDALKREQKQRVYKCTASIDTFKKGDEIGEDIFSGLTETRKMFFDESGKTTVKPKKKESRVNRFPVFYPIAPPNFMRGVNDKEVVPIGYYWKSRSNSKLPQIPYIGQGSHAMAAIQEGWYYKTGCCASIKTCTNGTTRIVYYIPDVGPMSLKKKIAYINELSKFLNGRISFLSVVEGTVLKHPLNPEQHGEKRLSLGDSNNVGVAGYPRTPIQVTRYITVYGKATNQYDRLLFLQFLRPLYQTIPVYYYNDANPNNGSATLVHSEYYQPQLYFRISRMFPELPMVYRMFLSFCLHGREISSTFFPYYVYRNGCKVKFNLSSYASINDLLSGGKSQVRSFPLENAPAIVSKEYDKVRSTDNTVLNYSHEFMSYLIAKVKTKEAYRQAMLILATCINDKELLNLVNPQTKKN